MALEFCRRFRRVADLREFIAVPEIRNAFGNIANAIGLIDDDELNPGDLIVARLRSPSELRIVYVEQLEQALAVLEEISSDWMCC